MPERHEPRRRQVRIGTVEQGLVPLYGEAHRRTVRGSTNPAAICQTAGGQCHHVDGTGRVDLGQLHRAPSAAYGAEVFRNAKVDDINGWVARKTEGKITHLMDEIDPNDPAVLLNAVYFKARWQATFSPSATKDEDFHLAAAKKIQTPMMHQQAHFAFATGPVTERCASLMKSPRLA
jgi:hypothetical protein